MSDYEVYAVRYATNEARRASENFLGGDPHDRPMPIDYFVWAIVGEERTVIVDSGFDEKSGAPRGRKLLRPVAEGLGELGIDCATVEDVVVTHMHWDHAGNHGLFPAARYHIQDKEMHFCTGRCMCHHELRRTFNEADVLAMVSRVYAGRAAFHDGSVEIFPGISLHWVGGHSMGLQVVRVRTRRGFVVLASDATHYYANMREGRPFPIIYNVGEMLEAFATLRALADGPSHIIPGHDPEVLRRFPRAHPDRGDTVRLDADPLPGSF